VGSREQVAPSAVGSPMPLCRMHDCGAVEKVQIRQSSSPSVADFARGCVGLTSVCRQDAGAPRVLQPHDCPRFAVLEFSEPVVPMCLGCLTSAAAGHVTGRLSQCEKFSPGSPRSQGIQGGCSRCWVHLCLVLRQADRYSRRRRRQSRRSGRFGPLHCSRAWTARRRFARWLRPSEKVT